MVSILAYLHSESLHIIQSQDHSKKEAKAPRVQSAFFQCPNRTLGTPIHTGDLFGDPVFKSRQLKGQLRM